MKSITLPLSVADAAGLRAGEAVLLTGVIYTARDAAHKKLTELIRAGQPLPFSIDRAVIYYTGPCPARPGQVIGSCGPTTSYRMDAYAPIMYEAGAGGAIGKGQIGKNVIEAMKKYNGVYFIAAGGAGALLAKCVRSAEEIAFPELGAEAVRRLYIEELPAVVGVDVKGGSIL